MSGEQFWVTVAIFTLGVLLIGGGFSRSQTPTGMALISASVFPRYRQPLGYARFFWPDRVRYLRT